MRWHPRSSALSRPTASCVRRESASSTPSGGLASARSGSALMRHILRRRELLTDEWRYLGEEAADTGPLIVPLAQLRSDPLRWQGRSGALGARLGPADPVEEL